MAPPDSGNPSGMDWGEYKRLVLQELDRLSKDVEAIKRAVSADLQDIRDRIDEFRRTEISPMKTELALLKFQAGMWGFAAGTGISLIVAVVARYVVK